MKAPRVSLPGPEMVPEAKRSPVRIGAPLTAMWGTPDGLPHASNFDVWATHDSSPMLSTDVRSGPTAPAYPRVRGTDWPTHRLTTLMGKAQATAPKRAADLGFYKSRLSESNRRPIHYEPVRGRFRRAALAL